MRNIICIVFAFFLSCNSNKTENNKENCEKPKEVFLMYKASEMAIVMEQMYVYNAQLRNKIIKNDSLDKLPVFFEKLSVATLTKGKERDKFFKEKTTDFLKTQVEIYTSKNKKESFNTMVNACIICHEVKCGGPIERIKKLYIR